MTSRPYLIWIGWLLILATAVWLRVDQLDERPMHADEATGARILSHRLEGDRYTFDPKHYHGPLLSYSSAILAKLNGEHSWQSLSKTGLRIGPVLAGVLLALSPLIWVRRLGHPAAMAAAAFLATSPLLVYYSRMYIHESLLALFSILACGLCYQCVERPQRRVAILAGICVGLMFATKETFVITALSWGVAGALCYICWQRKWLQAEQVVPFQTYLKPFLLLLLTATLTATFSYSNGFRSLSGVADAVRTYFVYETSAGHDKGLFYYLELLFWPKDQLGVWWTEIGVGLFALLAVVGSLLQRREHGLTLFLFISLIIHLGLYSLIGYKTPWLMLVPWAHACVLAGIGLQQIRTASTGMRVATLLLLAAVLGYQTQQSILSSGRFANDTRNPYAYVPTSKDVERLANWFTQLKSMAGDEQLEPVAVVGNGYWPLPWYLRVFETIGYWPSPIESMQSDAIVIAMPEQDAATNELLHNSHTALPRGLRNNVAITVYLRNDLWKQWSEQASSL